MNEEYIEKYDLETVLKVVMLRIDEMCVQDFFYLTKDDKKKIRHHIKLSQQKLDYIKDLIDEEAGLKKVGKDRDLEKLDFLDKKNIADGLRYLIVSIYEVKDIWLNITPLTIEAEDRIKGKLKTVSRHIECINNLIYKDDELIEN